LKNTRALLFNQAPCVSGLSLSDCIV